MSRAGARGSAIVILLVLLGAAPFLAALPIDLVTIRLAGLSLLWWYVTVAGPAVAVTVTIVALLFHRR